MSIFALIIETFYVFSSRNIRLWHTQEDLVRLMTFGVMN